MIRVDKESIKPFVTLAIIAAILYLFFAFISPLVLPFLLAVPLAALIERPIRWLESRRVPRPVAISVVLIAVLLVLTLLFVFGLATLTVELAQLSRSLPGLTSSIIAMFDNIQDFFELFVDQVPTYLEDFVRQQSETVLQWVVVWVRQLLDLIGHWTFQGIPNILFILLVTGVATYMMSRDREHILAFLPRLIPPRWRDQTVEVVARFMGSAIGYFNALVVLVSITASFTVVVLTLLGSPYALLIGILTGLLDVLPVVGPGLVFLPWAFYHLTVGETSFGLWLVVTYGVMAVGRTIIEPRIIGTRIGVHPLATLISLYVGLRLFGVTGFIIGPMVAILLVSLGRTGLFRFENGYLDGE